MEVELIGEFCDLCFSSSKTKKDRTVGEINNLLVGRTPWLKDRVDGLVATLVVVTNSLSIFSML